jgi:hypothetical protein
MQAQREQRPLSLSAWLAIVCPPQTRAMEVVYQFYILPASPFSRLAQSRRCTANCTVTVRRVREQGNTGSLIRGAKRGRRAWADSHPRANMTIFRSVLWSMAHGLAGETARGALDNAQAWWWIRGPSAGREQRRRCLKQGLAGWKQDVSRRRCGQIGQRSRAQHATLCSCMRWLQADRTR